MLLLSLDDASKYEGIPGLDEGLFIGDDSLISCAFERIGDVERSRPEAT